SGDVFVLNAATGQTLARAAVPGGGVGGAPHLADIDGDGRMEVVVAGATRLSALDYIDNGVTRTLRTLWTVPIQDSTSGVASATSIDLTYDGVREVIFAD